MVTVRRIPAPCCAFCGRNGYVVYDDLGDRLFSVEGRYAIRRCPDRACGLGWLDPAPIEADLPALYRDYFTHATACDRPRGRRHALPSLTTVFEWAYRCTPIGRERVRIAGVYLPHERPGRVLDVGCGDGARLAWLRARGWDVVGQDIDAEAARTASARHNVRVCVGPLAQVGFSAQSFDAISLGHVLEHAVDPVALLRTCRALVKPGGVIVCLTPNLDSWGHHRFGRGWLGLDPPRHLHLFSPVSLRAVARLAGLTSSAVWTTAANAQSVAAGSLDLKWSGRHQVGARTRLDRQIAAALLQLAASARHLADPDSGDECVLHANV